MTDDKKSGFFKALFGAHKTNERGMIPLHIPLTLKMEKDAEQNVEGMWNQTVQQRLNPLLLLQAANRYLEKINPLPLSYEQRTRVSNVILGEVVSAVSSLFSRFFQQGGGIPETGEQRDTVSHAVRAVGQLAVNYKLLFRQDWVDPDQNQATQERILLVTLRVFECARLEQLLLAFRYQKLPMHTWQDVNQLYFALRDEWNIKAEYPLEIHWTVRDAMSSVELFPKTANLEQLFLAIQLTGLLDVISWPVHLAYRVGRYLSAIEEPFIKDDDRLDDIPAGHCIVYHDQGGPSRFTRNAEQGGSSLLIDLNPILRRAIQDRAALTSGTKSPNISATLREIPERDRITFLDLLLHRVQPRQRNEPRQRIFHTRHARIYGGFDVVYRLLKGVHCRESNSGVTSDDGRFCDTLAEHINPVPEGQGVNEPRWVITDEGAGGIHLHVRESEYGLPLYVGRLVAYSDSEEALDASRVGYVVRLQRTGDDEAEVAIARIRGEIRPTMVEDQDSMEQQSLPALLIRAKDGKFQLLCDNKYSLITGERLAVMDGDHRHSGALGELVISQADFSVFQLHTSE
ncbi:MAG: hypothetical protein P8173_08350 [Gammaproteobacteria bacterium]|jgi:hypothetical protein